MFDGISALRILEAKRKSGWEPKIQFEELVKEMVHYDIDQAKRFATLRNSGFNVALRTK
jgi:GDPmannose 4,6-dehydratase